MNIDNCFSLWSSSDHKSSEIDKIGDVMNDIPSTRTSKRRIPLQHIDNINSSLKHMIKLDVQLNAQQLKFIEIAGECPTYLLRVNERLEQLKTGDFIVRINEQNVSRASSKSVKKILNKCPSHLNIRLTVYRAPTIKVSQIEQHTNLKHVNRQASSIFNIFISKSCVRARTENQQLSPTLHHRAKMNSSIDYGYCSIPSKENLHSISSGSINSTLSVASSSNSSHRSTDDKINSSIESLLDECGLFLKKMQCAIDTYTRPCLNILGLNEYIILYQNVEKLIPVTRFFTNLLRTTTTSDSIKQHAQTFKIVFESFKTYLIGLPLAIELLDRLTNNNQKFSKFISQDTNELKSLSIMDFLFMPLNFVQTILSHFVVIERHIQNQHECHIKTILIDLYQCSTNVYANLSAKMRHDESSITNVSNLSSINSTSIFSSICFECPSPSSSLSSINEIDFTKIQYTSNTSVGISTLNQLSKFPIILQKSSKNGDFHKFLFFEISIFHLSYY